MLLLFLHYSASEFFQCVLLTLTWAVSASKSCPMFGWTRVTFWSMPWIIFRLNEDLGVFLLLYSRCCSCWKGRCEGHSLIDCEVTWVECWCTHARLLSCSSWAYRGIVDLDAACSFWAITFDVEFFRYRRQHRSLLGIIKNYQIIQHTQLTSVMAWHRLLYGWGMAISKDMTSESRLPALTTFTWNNTLL